jgi:hypothetical protein
MAGLLILSYESEVFDSFDIIFKTVKQEIWRIFSTLLHD